MPEAKVISFRPANITLRVHCRTTPEQNRKMYLAMRPAWEASLAQEWRLSQSSCNKCGYRHGEHAVWCEYVE